MTPVIKLWTVIYLRNAVLRSRMVIDNIDSLIVKLLGKRLKTSAGIQKLKSSGLFFSPSREKQILSKCPSPQIADIYMAVMRNSRNAPKGLSWIFLPSGDAAADETAKKYFTKVFGEDTGIKEVKDLNNALKKAGKGLVIISPAGGLETAADKAAGSPLYRYCDYRLKKKLLFVFYSSVPPAFEDDLGVEINL